MDHSHATLIEDAGPISPDWTTPHAPAAHDIDATAGPRPRTLDPFDPDSTVDDLLRFLADDSRQHDPALRPPLLAIERALTGHPWRGAPSTVAVIRSIADAARRTPALRGATLSSLVD
ncbi:hypothetical protein [Streptomyces sp. AC495_CC817]|uniref:hypothetical protein n=1 Tax=Streptomyces sp. AC495_CC817 TaxID=2823900 RepID=UPI001C2615B2|nr:hypothetical protein [Streptomyces sp. AC495_CC817]